MAVTTLYPYAAYEGTDDNRPADAADLRQLFLDSMTLW